MRACRVIFAPGIDRKMRENLPVDIPFVGVDWEEVVGRVHEQAKTRKTLFLVEAEWGKHWLGSFSGRQSEQKGLSGTTTTTTTTMPLPRLVVADIHKI
jgi:hypothetical protein